MNHDKISITNLDRAVVVLIFNYEVENGPQFSRNHLQSGWGAFRPPFKDFRFNEMNFGFPWK